MVNIGYYAHSHGTGHCRQADKLARQWSHIILNGDYTQAIRKDAYGALTVFTSMPPDGYRFEQVADSDVIRLPDEHEQDTDVLPGRAGDYWQPECLHYSPVGSQSIQKRSKLLLSQVVMRCIELMIIDVSVEVALLCRTASVPYLYVRLPGDRNDAPHRNAYEGALALIAAYPKILESADTPQWVQDKTIYLGFSSKFTPSAVACVDSANCGCTTRLSADVLRTRLDFLHFLMSLATKIPDAVEATAKTTSAYASPSFIVTVIKGFGGHQNIDNKLELLRQMLPSAFIISLGPIENSVKSYVDMATTVEDVTPFLQHSDMLVMACGLNAIGEACQFETPILVVPDARPHQEQFRMAQALIACGRAKSFEGLLDSLNSRGQQSLADIQSLHQAVPPSDPTLTKALSVSDSYSFVNSLVQATSVKKWFFDWVLPQLFIQPVRK